MPGKEVDTKLLVLLGNSQNQDNITCLGDRESKPKPSNMLKVLLE